MKQPAYRPYITPLLDEHRQRGTRSILSLLGISNRALRTRLGRMLGGEPGSKSALLADPVFEPTFGWHTTEQTMSSMPTNLLHPRLKQAMTSPPDKLIKEYAFPPDRHPFSHQLEAWKILGSEEVQSVVVTSGTGSGKTECFMVPILNRLAHLSDREGPLQGVRALFIYPLNALIASQQNRLDAWTHGFNGDLRYCLYTGNLPEDKPKTEPEYRGIVHYRKALRTSAPPLLITNATMLEYMLVRRNDAPILAQSQGKLEWIVLDEAHTHMGSQAAEMALLLRRTMLAFGVKPENVRFVATSATFGNDAQTTSKLQLFLADMAGVQPEQVHVVHGYREIPALINATPNADTLETLTAIETDLQDSDLRYRALAGNQTAVALRNAFIEKERTVQRTLSNLVSRTGLPSSTVLQWLDLLSGTRDNVEQAFLPLRIHLFHNIMSGVGCCANPDCRYRTDELRSDPDWHFGELYIDGRIRCECGAPVLPLVQCSECSEVFLSARLTTSNQLTAPVQSHEDEFTLDLEQDDDEDSPDKPTNTSGVLVTNQAFGDSTEQVRLSLSSGKVDAAIEDSEVAKLTIRFDGHTRDCPRCRGSSKLDIMRRMGVGAPFTLSTVISTLLEFCPEDSDKPKDKPSRGRKMISFTDSRQGTARIAVKLQQDSERAMTRSFVYHQLLNSKNQVTLSEEDLEDIQILRDKKAKGQLLSRPEQNYLNEKEEVLKERTNTPVNWETMKHALASHGIEKELLDYYRSISRVFGNEDYELLAEMLLLAEFCRRPKRQNSLESMGLVRVNYPALKLVTRVPQGWPGTIDEWRDYLKVLLDFHVRENSFVTFSNVNYAKLIGQRVNLKSLLPPTSSEQESTRIKRWPQMRMKELDAVTGHRTIQTRQARPVNLLIWGLGWSAETHHEQIDAILCAAWKDLTDTNILTRNGNDGFALEFSKLELQLVDSAALCPVTRRFLDTVFKGFSPYLSGARYTIKRQLEWHEIPLYDQAFGGELDRNDAITRARNWLNGNTQVIALREEGLWSDLHDRIIEGASFFRTAEHSAQQNAAVLRHYEDKFKEGKLNVMCCSTTMEMGVDIGGISIVAMNNVPPHPANYLQRAGRAGRRNESRSVAMTVCKRSAHDQGVFKRPLWPFITNIAVPTVAFNSRDLVQRHVNAFLLSSWLANHVRDDELTTFNTGAFFNPVGDYSIADRFGIWCDNSDKQLLQDPKLGQALERLVYHTALEGTRPTTLINQSREHLALITAEWLKTASAIRCQMENVFKDESERNPALIALTLQLNRFEGEYLLSELATKRFFPGYGFPTDIVPFDNLHKNAMPRVFNDKNKEREDNRGRYRKLASRDRGTALREYAPGADIVMDGLVYRSGGVTLNWHAPASEADLREIQLFKYAWRCDQCGTSGDSHTGRPTHCESCSSELNPKWLREYLVPSGFAVDFFEEPHNDISQPAFVPVQEPWLSVDSTWSALANPILGKVRSSNHAHLFQHNSGAGGKGFAICLECGRAEPMLRDEDKNAPAGQEHIPNIFRTNTMHWRLRGGKGKTGESRCTGSDSDWKIKTNVHLGHDSSTDACELILQHGDTGLPLSNGVIAYTLAVALRTVIAAELGIQEEELGCTTRVLNDGGRAVQAIQLYDARSGGYCSQIDGKLKSADIWRKVHEQLSCSNQCVAACEHCLISFDTQHHAEQLDRSLALNFLDNRWLDQLALPIEYQLFGESSTVAPFDLADSLSAYTMHHTVSEMLLWPDANLAEWDVPAAVVMNSQIPKWLLAGQHVTLAIPPEQFSSLDEDSRFRLSALMELGLVLAEVRGSRPTNPMLRVAALARLTTGETHAWAVGSECNLTPSEQWLIEYSPALVVEGSLPGWPTLVALQPADVRPAAGDKEISLQHQCDGTLQGFGKRFWACLAKENVQLKAILNSANIRLTSVLYQDRYLNSPDPIALLAEVLHALGTFPFAEDGLPVINLTTRAVWKPDGTPLPRLSKHDWITGDERDAILKRTLEYSGLNAKLELMRTPPHGRMLELGFENGSHVIIRFDQGVSYWGTRSPVRFPFNREIDEQAEEIIKMNPRIEGHPDFATQVFVNFR
jgi:hypothetical protein